MSDLAEKQMKQFQDFRNNLRKEVEKYRLYGATDAQVARRLRNFLVPKGQRRELNRFMKIFKKDTLSLIVFSKVMKRMASEP